ncbi:CAP domain-containing protein [Streptomyces sp. G45]|uniref:CAP domain-containing protein n=1 Tax=Streptomyces sp. G45 TaxID=3406627 RepID=UPI003C1570FB
MYDLVPGGNAPLPPGPLTLRVPGPFDLSAVITGDDGKVAGDADFVFYNQPTAPGARLGADALTVDAARLRPGASRVTLVVSPAEPETPLGRLPAVALRVEGPRGEPVARFAAPRPREETALLVAEIYRRGPAWKLRALGQGYADGLAGVARDFGLDVTDEPDPADPPGAPVPASEAVTVVMPRPRVSAAAPAPAPTAAPPGPLQGFLAQVNAARAAAGAPAVQLDARLTEAARAHSAGMAQRGALATEGPDGTSLYQRVSATGYAYLAIGEHLVSGPRDPVGFLDYCLGQDRTRGTVLERAFTHVGVAEVTDRRGDDVFWTAVWAEPFSPGGLARATAEVLALTNGHRAAAGLGPLAPDPRLAAAAQGHSADMVARGFYAHTAPDGSEPWDRAAAAGSTHRRIGENIACGQRSPTEVVTGWMNSPGHRANILKPSFTHLGVGFVGGGAAGTYWTQLFGG